MENSICAFIGSATWSNPEPTAIYYFSGWFGERDEHGSTGGV